MQGDYIVTIFSRHKAKTRSVRLSRRMVYSAMAFLGLLTLSALLFGHGFFQERGRGRRLHEKVVQLEQVVAELEAGVEESEAVFSDVNVDSGSGRLAQEIASSSGEADTSANAGTSGATASAATEEDSVYAVIDDPGVVPQEHSSGFRFRFKLVNEAEGPISGNVAIIASLKPPHTPRFVSFPRMRLVDGMPEKLKKSVSFYIHRFKYVTGKFAFPFSHAESFRVLIYDDDEHLVLDATLPADKVDASLLLSETASSRP
jgi:hypothetical protein